MKKYLLIATLALLPSYALADPVMDLKFPKSSEQLKNAELDFQSTGSVVKTVKSDAAKTEHSAQPVRMETK